MVNHGPSADGWWPSCRAEILAGLLWNLRGILWQNTGGGRKWMVYGWHMHTYIHIYIYLMEEENISWYLIFEGFIWVSLKCDHVVLICIHMIHCRLRMFNSHLYRCIVKRCVCVPISPSTWQPCYGNVWPPKWIDPKAGFAWVLFSILGWYYKRRYTQKYPPFAIWLGEMMINRIHWRTIKTKQTQYPLVWSRLLILLIINDPQTNPGVTSWNELNLFSRGWS